MYSPWRPRVKLPARPSRAYMNELHRPKFQIAINIRQRGLSQAAHSRLSEIAPDQRIRQNQSCTKDDQRYATEHEQRVAIGHRRASVVLRKIHGHGDLLI